jgi:hypothetical protein
MTSLLTLDVRPGRARHRRSPSADRTWAWTAVVGLAYLGATVAYLIVQVRP